MHITNNHPNILSVYFTNQNGYACEFAEYGSLKNVIQQQKEYIASPTAQENEVLDLNYWRVKFALDIALGMAHLHESKVLHNDLKSSNIMITTMETGYGQEWDVPVAKLSDFGVSSTPLLNKTDNNLLKSYYSILPPECLQNSSTLQQKSEVFLYGVILWEMLTLLQPIFKKLDGTEMNEDEIKQHVLNGGRLLLPTVEKISNSEDNQEKKRCSK